ncbi:N-acetyl-gamma-glutamyl-phosphate reductase [Agaribacterium haliotis]|uniref:N-acetyl-gamma-glutamyl-phosphate reductase n=1 Tax=Agaribacterium haliotis TaxID=2013869 RepID=UPI000BB579B2|nr:N-acetyl-gamma-glutamyl-phosphate reductase [Agaribacterium haliotis]
MIKVAIVGATGYTGAELLRLLSRHSQVEVAVVTSRAEAGKRLDALFPSLRGVTELEFVAPETQALLACDVVFFATPHGVAQAMMKELIDGGVRVIDLSADFRIKDIELWEKWYSQKHACPELLEQAVYGLPELNREQIKGAQLVACPGCYPTSVQLALLPLLKAGWVDTSSIIANSASGISGAGRNAKTGLLMAENYDSFKAYSVAGHRHLPEIKQGLAAMAGVHAESIGLTFVPHLLPTIRGIHSTVYVRANDQCADVQALFESSYRDEAFVDVLPQGMYPETRTVKGTNTCRLSVENPGQEGVLVLMSVIDNLAKGASAQGVQNLNLMFGFAETEGLEQIALLP